MRLDAEIEELRKELGKFRTETRQRLEAIEGEVTKQVSLNYNHTIVNYLVDVSADAVRNLKCDRGVEETTCKATLMGHQQRFTSLLKTGRFDDAYVELNKVKETMQQFHAGMKQQNRTGCTACIQNEIDVLTSSERLLAQLRSIKTPALTLEKGRATVDSLDPETATEQLLEPLSNKTRLTIMKSVFRGENRFTDFVKATGLEGGQLLYHIRKLLDSGHIQQFESKDYVLTRKGMRSMMLVAQLNEELSETQALNAPPKPI
jgi:DNA-binding HxlR family transcriptional regulator